MIRVTHQPVPIPPAPPGGTRQELAELDDRELLAIAGSLPRFSQRRMAACELLVGRYRYLVWSGVQRYSRGPEPAEDLTQVGTSAWLQRSTTSIRPSAAPWPPMPARI